MPEYAALAIGFCGDNGFFYGFADGKILVVSGQNLRRTLLAYRKTDEIFEDIQKPLALEYAFIEGVKLRKGGVFIIAVLRFPFHKAVEAGGNRARLVGAQVADHANRIVVKDARNILHIVPNLVKGVFSAHFVLGGRFQFDQHQRKAVYEQNDIRAALVAVFNIGELIDGIEIIPVHALIVDQVDDGVPLFALDEVSNRHAVLQIIHKGHVFLQKAAAAQILELCKRFRDCPGR